MYEIIELLAMFGAIFTGFCWGSCNYLIKKISQNESDPKKNYKLIIVLISERLSSVIFILSLLKLGFFKRFELRKYFS